MNVMDVNDCESKGIDNMKYKDNNPHETIVEQVTPVSTNEPLYPKLPDLLYSVSKIIKEARHNDLMYPELFEIHTYRDLTIWIRNHYRLFYSVFQKDLLDIMASIPKKNV